MSHDDADHEVMSRVRRALGRSAAPASVEPPPAPPELPDSVVRLVRGDVDLPKMFAQRAAELKMIVTTVTPASAAAELVKFIAANPRIKKVALSVSPLLERLKIRDALAASAAGLTVKTWDHLTLDELYDYDCAVTDVDFAVAESGSLVIKPTKSHGRGLSLVPMDHVAFVEEKQILPDLVDLFRELALDADRSNVILISGPSKTADIEMNVVTGVHGPNVVRAFVLQ